MALDHHFDSSSLDDWSVGLSFAEEGRSQFTWSYPSSCGSPNRIDELQDDLDSLRGLNFLDGTHDLLPDDDGSLAYSSDGSNHEEDLVEPEMEYALDTPIRVVRRPVSWGKWLVALSALMVTCFGFAYASQTIASTTHYLFPSPRVSEIRQSEVRPVPTLTSGLVPCTNCLVPWVAPVVPFATLPSLDRMLHNGSFLARLRKHSFAPPTEPKRPKECLPTTAEMPAPPSLSTRQYVTLELPGFEQSLVPRNQQRSSAGRGWSITMMALELLDYLFWMILSLVGESTRIRKLADELWDSFSPEEIPWQIGWQITRSGEPPRSLTCGGLPARGRILWDAESLLLVLVALAFVLGGYQFEPGLVPDENGLLQSTVANLPDLDDPPGDSDGWVSIIPEYFDGDVGDEEPPPMVRIHPPRRSARLASKPRVDYSGMC